MKPRRKGPQVQQRITSIAAKALARTAAETAKASNAAAEAGRIALDQLNKDIANAGVARDTFGGAKRLVSIFADKPVFIQRVSDTIKLQGAIVAFSRTTGCPTGWNLFDAAIGKTIVGATPPVTGAAGLRSIRTELRSFLCIPV